MDLEMHTVHLAKETKNEIGYAAVGIMFSVEEYTSELTWAEQKVIDTFFDSLKWDTIGTQNPANSNFEENPVDMVIYGTLMEMVNSKNRWVYKGSVTTPPCGRFVYWNVLSTVYPISRKHLL
jgi:carbonic anhydrase